MIYIEASCILSGPNYSPALAEQLTQLRFAEKNEAGEIGSVGRYKGKPIPYGSSTLKPTAQITAENKHYGLEWLLERLIASKEGLERAGVSEMILSLHVTHDGQCNLECPPELSKAFALSGATVTVSCYEDAAYVHKQLGQMVA